MRVNVGESDDDAEGEGFGQGAYIAFYFRVGTMVEQ